MATFNAVWLPIPVLADIVAFDLSFFACARSVRNRGVAFVCQAAMVQSVITDCIGRARRDGMPLDGDGLAGRLIHVRYRRHRARRRDMTGKQGAMNR